MRCPSCDAEIHHPDALFCPVCGNPLSESEAKATDKLAPSTREEAATGEATPEAGAHADGGSERTSWSRLAPVRDFTLAARGWFVAGGWADAAGAAALGFLGVLFVGLILVVAAKLDEPALGVGTTPFAILTATVMVALGSLGVMVHVGGLDVSVLPLGALAVGGWAIASAARVAVARRDAQPARARVLEGAKVGVPFALLCWLAALVFRYRTIPGAAADPLLALLLGAFWGAAFGALGGLASGRDAGSVAAEAAGGLRARSQAWYEGVVAAGVMLIAAALLAAGVGLLWIIVGLVAGGAPGDFGVGDALAGVLYLAAFLPNVLVAIITVSLGAPIQVGAQVTFEGAVVGSLQEYSLFEWGQTSAPWYAFALLAIPLLACLFGGFTARRNSTVPGETLEVLGVAAVAFSAVLALLAAIGEARLGGGLVREQGFGLLAPHPGWVFVLALLWAAVSGFIGWRIGQYQAGRVQTPPGAAPEG